MSHTCDAPLTNQARLLAEHDSLADMAQDRSVRAPVFDEAFVEVAGEKYREHPNGGGLVAVSATVAPNVYVGPHAMVKDRAIVVGSVRLFDRSIVEGASIVADMGTLRDDASIGGDAIVRGQVTLAHHARVDGDARVNGGVLLQHFAYISRGVLSGGMTVN